MGEVIVSPLVIIVFIVIVIIGTVVLQVVATKKWGYTKKREKELERQIKEGFEKENNRGKKR